MLSHSRLLPDFSRYHFPKIFPSFLNPSCGYDNTTQLLRGAYSLQHHLCYMCNAGSSASDQPEAYQVLKIQGRWKAHSLGLGFNSRSQAATAPLMDAPSAFQARHPHQSPEHFIPFLVPFFSSSAKPLGLELHMDSPKMSNQVFFKLPLRQSFKTPFKTPISAGA